MLFLIFNKKRRIEIMDLDSLNPNWDLARNHGKAVSIGIPEKM